MSLGAAIGSGPAGADGDTMMQEGAESQGHASEPGSGFPRCWMSHGSDFLMTSRFFSESDENVNRGRDQTRCSSPCRNISTVWFFFCVFLITILSFADIPSPLRDLYAAEQVAARLNKA